MYTIPVAQPITTYVLLALALVSLPVLLLRRLSSPPSGWRWGGWPAAASGLGWGALLGAGLVAWLRVLLQTENYLPVLITPSPSDWAVLALAAPVVEELALRGVLLGSLQRAWSPFWALCLAAGADVLMHAHQPWLAAHFVAALGYGLAFRQSRSLAAPMLAHALAVTALLLGRMHPSAVGSLPSHWLLAVAGGGVALLVLGLLGRGSDRSDPRALPGRR